MKGWDRPAVAGWWMGQPVRFRLRGSRGWKVGTIADVYTDGDGKATALLLAVTPDERHRVPIARLEPVDGHYLSGTPLYPPALTANGAVSTTVGTLP